MTEGVWGVARSSLPAHLTRLGRCPVLLLPPVLQPPVPPRCSQCVEILAAHHPVPSPPTCSCLWLFTSPNASRKARPAGLVPLMSWPGERGILPARIAACGRTWIRQQGRLRGGATRRWPLVVPCQKDSASPGANGQGSRLSDCTGILSHLLILQGQDELKGGDQRAAAHVGPAQPQMAHTFGR